MRWRCSPARRSATSSPARQRRRSPSSPRGPSREDAANRLFADLEPADPRLGARALHAAPDRHLRPKPVKLDSFWSQPWKASVIWCRRAHNPGEAHQRRAAERLKAKLAELDTGHYPMLSMPEELTAMLIE